MNKTLAFSAVTGAALISSAASAVVYNPALDQTFALGSLVMPASGTGGGLGPTLTMSVPANPTTVVGMTISFDYVESPSDSSWASDLALRITGPGIPGAFTVSGTDGGGGAFGLGQFIWSFDGAGSDGPTGSFSSTFWFKATPWQKPGGAWTVETAHTWDGSQTYNNFTIVLHKIPAPGAMALLGLGGLVGTRRRRA